MGKLTQCRYFITEGEYTQRMELLQLALDNAVESVEVANVDMSANLRRALLLSTNALGMAEAWERQGRTLGEGEKGEEGRGHRGRK